MKKYNIVTGKAYKAKDGSDKTQWNTVGNLIELDGGKMFIELFMFPETKFSVFEPKPRENEPPSF